MTKNDGLREVLLRAKCYLETLGTIKDIVEGRCVELEIKEILPTEDPSQYLDQLILDATEVQLNGASVEQFASKYKLTSRTKQPAPIPKGTIPIHDAIIMDLMATFDPDGNVGLLMKGLNDRKAIGLERYGTYLQAFNGRDCEVDAIEEVLDMICYLKQGIMEGKTYLEPIYHRAIALAVDTINLREINVEAQERKAALAIAPYYDVVVEVDGIVECYKTRALSAEEAARRVLDYSICPPSKTQSNSVKLISCDLT